MKPISTPEHPTVAHRPALAPHQQYVQWTEHHQHQAQGLPPCAIHLWQYLLYKYPGGVPQEIDLEEIRVEISGGRSKNYCVQSLKNALWKYLVPRGLVAVVKQFTKRIMRVVANHAGPTKEIEKKFESSKFNLHIPKQSQQFEPETAEITSSIQSSSENPQTPVGSGCCDNEELKEIQAALADAPFMQDDSEQESSPPIETPAQKEFSAAVTRCFLSRLCSLSVPLTNDARSLIAKTSEAQLERNISALEEEAATKGLKSPIAAFKYFVMNNCQPRNDRQSWWNRAAVALGKQRRDLLIQSVIEYAGATWVMFTNGHRVTLQEVQGLSWEAIATLERCHEQSSIRHVPVPVRATQSYSTDWRDATGSDPAWDEHELHSVLENSTTEPDGNAQDNSTEAPTMAKDETTDSSHTPVEVVEELSPEEEADRQRLELKVERAFFEAGLSLRELRDRRLYRSTHKSWQAYCKDRFGYGRDSADLKISAAGVVENLEKVPTIGRQILPTNERQGATADPLEPEEQRQVWKEAVESVGGKVPSGKIVKGILSRRKKRDTTPPAIPYQTGDVVEIRAGCNPDLRKHDGCWGIVTHVGSFSCTIHISVKM